MRRIDARGELLLDPTVCPRTGRLAYASWRAAQRIGRLKVGSEANALVTPVSFNSTRSDFAPRLYLYELVSGRTRRLADVSESIGSRLTVFPDGKTFFFVMKARPQADLELLEGLAE